MALDDGQDVVEVVGDAGGELADGIHLLNLAKLRLQVQAIRGVLGVAVDDPVRHDRKEGPGQDSAADVGVQVQPVLAGGQAHLHDVGRVQREDGLGMVLLQRTRHLLRRVVEIGERSIGGKLQDRVRVEAREGRQLSDLSFGALAIRSVARDEQRPLRFAVIVKDVAGGGLEADPVALAVAEPKLCGPALVEKEGFVQRFLERPAVVGMNQRRASGRQELFDGEAQHQLERGRGIDEITVEIQQADQVARVLGDQPILLLAAAQCCLSGLTFVLGLILGQGPLHGRRQALEA